MSELLPVTCVLRTSFHSGVFCFISSIVTAIIYLVCSYDSSLFIITGFNNFLYANDLIILFIDGLGDVMEVSLTGSLDY